VEVALVLVLFASVMFWKLLVPVKEFVPEKVLAPANVLLFARRVEEAPVMLLLQPKEPFTYDSAWEAELQVLKPAPKKFVVEALWAKRFVAVAFVVVLFTAVTFWKLDWFATPVPVAVRLVKTPLKPKSVLAKRFVEEAWVLVLLESVMFAKLVAPVKEFVPENVLLFARSVVEAPEVLRHVPAILKQPFVRLKPFAAVLVAAPVSANWSAEMEPAKVEVPCPAPTVIAAANVEVAEVEVALMLLKTPKVP
jgi:hypothetical protein